MMTLALYIDFKYLASDKSMYWLCYSGWLRKIHVASTEWCEEFLRFFVYDCGPVVLIKDLVSQVPKV